MTKLDALRHLFSTPRQETVLGRIGYRVIYAQPDGRERLTFTVRVLRAVLRKKVA